MGIEGLFKVGIAVKSLDEAAELFAEVLGLTSEEAETYEPLGMRYGLCHLGDVMVELIESTTPDGPIARFIENHGEGLQHIALKVSNVEEAISQLKEKGIQFVQETPVEVESASGRFRFVFARPQSFHGVLVQFIEVL